MAGNEKGRLVGARKLPIPAEEVARRREQAEREKQLRREREVQAHQEKHREKMEQNEPFLFVHLKQRIHCVLRGGAVVEGVLQGISYFTLLVDDVVVMKHAVDTVRRA